jgi:hypothetical protein
MKTLWGEYSPRRFRVRAFRIVSHDDTECVDEFGKKHPINRRGVVSGPRDEVSKHALYQWRKKLEATEASIENLEKLAKRLTDAIETEENRVR